MLIVKIKGRIWLGTERGIVEFDKSKKQSLKIALPAMPANNYPRFLDRKTKPLDWYQPRHLGHGATKPAHPFTRRPRRRQHHCFCHRPAGPSLGDQLDQWPQHPVSVQARDSRHYLAQCGTGMCLYAAVDGRIWVGTQDKGIQIYNPRIRPGPK